MSFHSSFLIIEIIIYNCYLDELSETNYIAILGARKVVNIGDKKVDYNESFKLFLATRNSKPNMTEDARALITLVNFKTTRVGLTGQVSKIDTHKTKCDFI